METSTLELADRVHSLAIHLLRRVRAADVDSGLSAARLSALSVLVYGGARTVSELAAAEQVAVPTMSRLVSALASAGLVLRESDAADARRVRVVATSRGEAALVAARSRRVESLASLLGPIEPERREAVSRAVSILESALAGEAG